jgi:hypothetical protein
MILSACYNIITQPYIIVLVLHFYQKDLFWEDILPDIIALFGIPFLSTYYVSSVNAPSLLPGIGSF